MARQAIVVAQHQAAHRAAARLVVAHHELRSEHRSHRAEAHRAAVLQVWVAHRAIAVARQVRQVHRAIVVVRRRAVATVAVAAAIRAARRVAHIVAVRTRAVAHIRAEETLVADSSFTI